jgi:hypothetical protein
MHGHIKTARIVATVFAALLVSSVAVGAAIGPAYPVATQIA